MSTKVTNEFGFYGEFLDLSEITGAVNLPSNTAIVADQNDPG